MDRIETIILYAFKYENQMLPPVKNEKQPTWWPHIARDYSAESLKHDDGDSWPIDLEEHHKEGNVEVYNWVMDKVINRHLTANEKIILRAFCGKGYKVTPAKASKILRLHGMEALTLNSRYERILIKIKKLFDNREISMYFEMVP